MEQIMYKTIEHTYKESCLIDEAELRAAKVRLAPEIERVKQAVARGGYASAYASANLPDDELLRAECIRIAQEKRALKPTILVVVGIGGSALGLAAVHQALYGTLYNEQQPTCKLYIADTVDSDYLNDILLLVEQELEGGNAVIITVISKSGQTTETVVNAQLFIDSVRKAFPETYRQYVVVITDEGSALWDYSVVHSMARLAIPALVGGRYSVLSAVGLFPLALLGIDIDALCSGAAAMRSMCIDSDIESNPAAMRALLLNAYYNKGVAIHDLFLFSVDLAAIGAWYRQLMGESLGKGCLEDGLFMRKGITPTVSMGTVDLHSVAQLYLGGPHVRFTTFVAVSKNNVELVVPNIGNHINGITELSAHVQGKKISSIMGIILQGVLVAYHKNKRPFVLLTIPEKNPYYIGMLLQLHMLEMMYAGFLLRINPFDQPDVELYKQETRKLLNVL